ncbi:hypothetical protein LR48_Vigan665s000100 [Vigna angularis]|uniref:Uncharacterized protein n=1 Tax=Phaseolus angularis TaxID=3914 RepID=A0A0L9TG20_PHAAN|nr:hypothetical protein LR48_Vigan665s000100 [Vigna angularis]
MALCLPLSFSNPKPVASLSSSFVHGGTKPASFSINEKLKTGNRLQNVSVSISCSSIKLVHDRALDKHVVMKYRVSDLGKFLFYVFEVSGVGKYMRGESIEGEGDRTVREGDRTVREGDQTVEGGELCDRTVEEGGRPDRTGWNREVVGRAIEEGGRPDRTVGSRELVGRAVDEGGRPDRTVGNRKLVGRAIDEGGRPDRAAARRHPN